MGASSLFFLKILLIGAVFSGRADNSFGSSGAGKASPMITCHGDDPCPLPLKNIICEHDKTVLWLDKNLTRATYKVAGGATKKYPVTYLRNTKSHFQGILIHIFGLDSKDGFSSIEDVYELSLIGEVSLERQAPVTAGSSMMNVIESFSCHYE